MRIEYVCTDCDEEFAVSIAQWADADRVLLCPCCGSTDLARIIPAEAQAFAA
jgi:putative FmdB family regulatory protein